MAKPSNHERGVALLATLVSIALLTIVIMQMTYTTQVTYRRTRHWLAASQARVAAESGVALAAELLSFDGELARLVSNSAIPPEVAELAGGLDPRIAAVDGLTDFWARCSEARIAACGGEIEAECTLPLDLGSNRAGQGADDFFTVRIDDETGHYNLNRPYAHPLVSEYERLVRLLTLVGLDGSLAGAIVDWTDADSEPLPFPPGAEASRYLAENHEPAPRNAPFATYRELGLVLGVDAGALARLRPVTTVLPAPVSNVNVNTAPRAVLRALEPELETRGLLALLEAERCRSPFVDAADLSSRVPGIAETGVVPLLAFSSQWFRVRSVARVGDVVQSVEALLYRDGADIEPVYELLERGANIDDIDTPDASGFDRRMREGRVLDRTS